MNFLVYEKNLINKCLIDRIVSSLGICAEFINNDEDFVSCLNYKKYDMILLGTTDSTPSLTSLIKEKLNTPTILFGETREKELFSINVPLTESLFISVLCDFKIQESIFQEKVLKVLALIESGSNRNIDSYISQIKKLVSNQQQEDIFNELVEKKSATLKAA